MGRRKAGILPTPREFSATASHCSRQIIAGIHLDLGIVLAGLSDEDPEIYLGRGDPIHERISLGWKNAAVLTSVRGEHTGPRLETP